MRGFSVLPSWAVSLAGVSFLSLWPQTLADVMATLFAGSVAILTAAGGTQQYSCLLPNRAPLMTSMGMWEPGVPPNPGALEEARYS